MDLKEKTLRTILAHGLLAGGDRVLVALSGGADSVCLVHILCALRPSLGLEVLAAHFDHGLRPGEDAAETRFVERLSRDLGVALKVDRAVPGAFCGPGSPEERAREARYAFLFQVRAQVGARRIATAHHLDDQAETFLLRLLRGSGPAGLSGMRPLRQDGVIRPLLGVTRREILAYVAQHGLEYMEDSSNRDLRFLRNRIRHQVLPLLATIQPRIAHHLGNTAEILRLQEGYINAEAEAWLRQNGRRLSHTDLLVPLPRFNALPPALQASVVRCALCRVQGNLRGIGTNHIQGALKLAGAHRPQGELTLPKGLRVVKTYDALLFTGTQEEPPPSSFSFPIPAPGAYDVDPPGLRVTLEERTGGMPRTLRSSGWVAYLDGDRFAFPLTLRNFRHGDRFRPLGMKGSKKVKDLFIDEKIPSSRRRKAAILAQGDQILWVCGVRIDDRYKITEKTKRVVKIKLEPLKGNSVL